MGLKETMAAIAAKPKDQLTYTDVADTYIYYIRVDFDPVGIKFCADEDEIAKYKINAKAKAKLTYCQHLAMARGGHKAMFMPANMLLCENAEPVFGFRELDKEKDTKRHMKYLRNEELAWQAPQGKAKLPLGKCYGIYTAPLAMFDESGIDPDIVYFMLLPYQAYHVLNDYMAATGRSSLTFNHTPNSAVCSGSVWALNQQHGQYDYHVRRQQDFRQNRYVHAESLYPRNADQSQRRPIAAARYRDGRSFRLG